MSKIMPYATLPHRYAGDTHVKLEYQAEIGWHENLEAALQYAKEQAEENDRLLLVVRVLAEVVPFTIAEIREIKQ